MELQHRQDLFDLNHVFDPVGDDALDRGAQLREIAGPGERAEQRERRLREGAGGRASAAHASSINRTASAGTSSGRSRSGGRSMRTADSRR